MDLRLTKVSGFNPILGMPLIRPSGGAEAIAVSSLSSPIRAVLPSLAIKKYDCFLLFKVRLQDRISRLEVSNFGSIGISGTFFFAYFNDEGKVAVPRYSSAAGGGGGCLCSLGCRIAPNGYDFSHFNFNPFESLDVWDLMGMNDISGTPSGLKTFAYRQAGVDPGIAVPVASFFPQVEPDIMSIMNKALRASPGERGALNVDADGLAGMNGNSQYAAICFSLDDIDPAAGLVSGSNIMIKIGVIESNISDRPESAGHAKSFAEAAAAEGNRGVGLVDGVMFPYDPVLES